MGAGGAFLMNATILGDHTARNGSTRHAESTCFFWYRRCTAPDQFCHIRAGMQGLQNCFPCLEVPAQVKHGNKKCCVTA